MLIPAAPQWGSNLAFHSVQLCGNQLVSPEVFVVDGLLNSAQEPLLKGEHPCVSFVPVIISVHGLLFYILYGHLQLFLALSEEQCLTKRLVTQD